MPQTHQDPAEGKDPEAADQQRREPETPKEPSLLGPKGDPAEGKREIGPRPN